jgi:oligopeptidase A
MTYIDDASIREKLYRAYMTRASSGAHSNRENLLTILALRHERAQLLGYPNFSDYILENRMAKRASEAKNFVQSLYQRTHLQASRENAALQEFRARIEGPDAPSLQAWDVAYYAEKQRKAEYDFDEEAVRAYFPANTVIQGLFEVVKRIYGLTITKDPTLPTWHPSVEAYSVLNEAGRYVGSFYSDLYPRESKRGGAWMNAFIHGKAESGMLEPHLGLICGNFTPPTESKPALLSHDEVNTLFHEFGHLLHHLLSEVPIRALGGTHVAWDFVELPSQIMENWVWQRDVVDLLSGHYQTGEKLPASLFNKMVRARTFRAANFILRQLGFASLDLDLHTVFVPESQGDILDYCRKHAAPFSAAPLPSDYSMITAFTHLFSDPVGYGSGYYSYLWAEVLDADAFTRFEKEGIWNRVTGEAFRRAILSRGNSEEPMALFREFMGREPSIDALLVRAGLAVS